MIGVPDDIWGEAVKAIVVRAPGAATADEMITRAGGSRASRRRSRWSSFESLPRNPSGKILRRQLREPYWAGKDRRVN